MKTSLFRRTLCTLLAFVMVLGQLPAIALASEEDGLCQHHPAHTADCGYAPAVEGHPCAHEHGEECYDTVTECVHAHGDCGYVPAVEGQDCVCQPDEGGELVHTEGCGYVEAVAEVPCDHVCTEDSGCVTKELNCQHQHDEACGYVEAQEASPCAFQCPECTEKSTEPSQPEETEAEQGTEPETESETELETEPETEPETESETEPETETLEAVDEEIVNAANSGTCGENLTWKFQDGTLTISGTGDMRDYSPNYSYPNRITAPWGTNISKVVIQPGVTSLGAYSFYFCEKLTSISIPDSVTSLGEGCFWACTALKQITIPETVTSIGKNCFFACSNLSSVKLPETISEIPASCFGGCTSLSSFTIPDGVTALGENCFQECTGLKQITIPDRVTTLGYKCFSSCTGLTSITIGKNVTSFGRGWRDYCSSLSEVIFQDGRTTLPAGFFQDWPAPLTRVVLPNGLTELEASCFWLCTALTSITIPDSVTSIGENCFWYCTGLTSVKLPKSLSAIPAGCFHECTSLRNIEIPDGVTSLGDRCFESCTALTSVNIPNGVTSLGNSSFYGCTSLTSIEIPDGVTTLKNGCFWSCTALTSVHIPDSVTSLGKFCFEECTALTSVNIPNSITALGDSVFYGCTSLASIEIPDGVTSLGDSCFGNCTSLTSVKIPDGVTSLGYYCFIGCSNLTSIELPDSVTSIGKRCFDECSKLQVFDLSAIPNSIEFEAAMTLDDKVTVLPGFRSCVWEVETLPGEPEAGTIARVTEDPSGTHQLEAIGSGRFRLVLRDEETCAQGSTTLEVTGSTAVLAEQDYLFGGGKLQLTAVDLADSSRPKVQWAITEGADYASVSSGGVLTAKAVSQAQTVSVSAAVVGRGDRAYRSFRILPKSDGMILTMEDAPLESTLSLEMRDSSSLALSAYTPSVEEPLKPLWSTSNAKTAAVDKETGAVTLIAPGTAVITATAADGSGVKASVMLNVIYLDGAKTLTASVDAPAIGLQSGQEATITVSGNAPIDAAYLTFTSSNEQIAKVDENGVITAGTTPGTATITASLKGDPLKRKASVKVKVIPMQAEKLKVKVGDEELDALDLSRSAESRSYHLTALGRNYREEWFETNNVTWTATDASVAKVTVAKDGTAKLTIPGGANGECVITAVSNDLNKVRARLTVSVRDYSPRLGSSSLTLNSYAAQGVALDLRESYENRITGVALTGAPEGFRLDNDTRTLYAENVKNGTYKLTLQVTCGNGETYSYNLQVKVANSLPGVTVKQVGKFNLFYRDSTAELSVTAPGQTIENVVLTGTEDFVLEDGMLRYSQNPAAKPNTKATLEVYLQGYGVPVKKAITIATVNTAPKLSLSPASTAFNTARNDNRSAILRVYNQTEGAYLALGEGMVRSGSDFVTVGVENGDLTLTLNGTKGGTATLYIQDENWTQPVKLTHAVSVSTKDPTLKLERTSLTLNSTFTSMTDVTGVYLDQRNLPLEGVTITSTAKPGTDAAKQAEKLRVYYADGSIYAEIPGAAPKAGTYTYSCTGTFDGGSTKAVTLKVVVSATLPKVKLSASGLKLNTFLTGREYTQLQATVTGGAGYTLVGFTGAPDWMALSYNGEDGTLRVGLNQAPTGAKHVVELKPVFCLDGTGQTLTLPTAVKLTLQTYHSDKLGATLSAKGKLDTLNPDSAIDYTVTKLTNCLGTIDSVALAGQDGEKFVATLDTTGAKPVIHLTMKAGTRYATNVTYKVQFRVTMCGKAVTLPAVSFKVTQTQPKVTAVPAAVTLYQAQTQPAMGRLTLPVGEIESITLGDKTSGALKDALNISYTTGSTAQLTFDLENPYALTAGKSYTLYLDVTPKNHAANLKPIQVKLTVKVLK